jgi:hypothetical protein
MRSSDLKVAFTKLAEAREYRESLEIRRSKQQSTGDAAARVPSDVKSMSQFPASFAQ